MKAKIIISVFLFATVAAIYWQTRNFGYTALDDNFVVFENQQVKVGLSWRGVRETFSTFSVSNWNPLTRVSHMADASMFALRPGPQHLENAMIHAVNCILLFLVLCELTRRHWLSAFVAAVFAVHPLHVESVAWITERKDVLSVLFGLLAIFAYGRYAVARDKSASKTATLKKLWSRGSWPSGEQYWTWIDQTNECWTERTDARIAATYWYAFLLLAFAASLMSKPTLVTLPVLLLLLDWWPLERKASWKLLVLEKAPLFTFSAAISWVAWRSASTSGAAFSFHEVPIGMRITDAIYAYLIYIEKLFWPVNLSLFYPIETVPLQVWLAALATLCAITAVLLSTKYKAAIFGWFWFIISLLPMIGILQVGSQAYADRYMYIPSIGLSVLCTWGVAELLKGRTIFFQRAAITSAFVCVLVLGAIAYRQTQYWSDNELLLRHSIAVTRNNWLVHTNLGVVVGRRGRHCEELEEYAKAIFADPIGNPLLHRNIVSALPRLGRGKCKDLQIDLKENGL